METTDSGRVEAPSSLSWLGALDLTTTTIHPTLSCHDTRHLTHATYHNLRRSVRLTCQKAICDVVREFFASDQRNSSSGTVAVTEHCTSSNTAALNPLHRAFFHHSIMENDFDICFGYEVLTKECTVLFRKLSEECRASIRKICEIASDVALGQMVKELDAAPVIHSLRLALEAVYKGVGQVFHEKFYEKLTVTESVLDESLNSESQSEEDCALSGGEIEKYRKLRMAVKGYQELEVQYNKLWNLDPATCDEKEKYIDQKEPIVCHFQVESFFTYLDISDGKESVSLENFLTIEKGIEKGKEPPLALILHGLAGSGKSSLFRHLTHRWLNGGIEMNCLGKFDLILLIDIRRVRSSRLKEFLLDQLLPLTCVGLDSDHIIPTLKELDVLFLIDGYDEATRASSDLVEEVFAKFSDKRILVTTRPELHRDVVCLARRHSKDYVSLEIRGFADKRREEFFAKVFTFINADELIRREEWGKFLEWSRRQNKILHQYLNLPLTAALLVFLWTQYSETLNTATCLYQEIYSLLLGRVAERLSKDFIGVSDLPAILDKLLLCLGEQAWDMLREGNIVASEVICDRLETECEGKGIKVIEFLSGLHLLHLDENPDVWKLTVAFQHPAHARYLAATFLYDCLLKKKMKVQDIGSQINNCPGLEQLLMFLIGQLALKDNLTVVAVNEIFSLMKNIPVDSMNFSFWWTIFTESRNHPQVGIILAEEKLPQKLWLLNQTNVTTALRLLSLTPVRLKNLTIDISSIVEPHEILNFLHALEGVGPHLKKRQRKLIKVELYLWRHESCGHDKTSDNFLKALHHWGNLTSFVGSLGEQEEGLLTWFSNLRTIRVRVSSPGAFRSLSDSLKKIYRSVKSLNVTLTLPQDCPPEHLSDLKHNGTLEVTLVGMTDTRKEWLVGVVKTVGGRGGIWRLRLAHCLMTYDALEWVVRELRGHVLNKVDIESVS